MHIRFFNVPRILRTLATCSELLVLVVDWHSSNLISDWFLYIY